jgi:hypothetical protein
VTSRVRKSLAEIVAVSEVLLLEELDELDVDELDEVLIGETPRL